MNILKEGHNFINGLIQKVWLQGRINRNNGILIVTSRRIGCDDDSAKRRPCPFFNVHPVRDERNWVCFKVIHVALALIRHQSREKGGGGGEEELLFREGMGFFRCEAIWGRNIVHFCLI
jgi:hypothetical protein